MNAIAIALHLLSAVIWVGGMFFAYLVLRPALTEHSARPVPISGPRYSGAFSRGCGSASLCCW